MSINKEVYEVACAVCEWTRQCRLVVGTLLPLRGKLGSGAISGGLEAGDGVTLALGSTS